MRLLLEPGTAGAGVESGASGGLQLGQLAGEGSPNEDQAIDPAALGVHAPWDGAKEGAAGLAPCSSSARVYAGVAAPAVAVCTLGGAHGPIGRGCRAGASDELRYMLGWFSLVAPALGLPCPLGLWQADHSVTVAAKVG